MAVGNYQLSFALVITLPTSMHVGDYQLPAVGNYKYALETNPSSWPLVITNVHFTNVYELEFTNVLFFTHW